MNVLFGSLGSSSRHIRWPSDHFLLPVHMKSNHYAEDTVCQACYPLNPAPLSSCVECSWENVGPTGGFVVGMFTSFTLRPLGSLVKLALRQAVLHVAFSKRMIVHDFLINFY